MGWAHITFYFFFTSFFNFLIWSETNTLISDCCLELKRDFQDQQWVQSFVFLQEIIACLRERQNPMCQPCSPRAVWVVGWEPTRVISGSRDYSEHLGRTDKFEDGPVSGRNRAGRGWKEVRGGVSIWETAQPRRMKFQWRISQVEISLSSTVSSSLLYGVLTPS